jgi:hypothetical protein
MGEAETDWIDLAAFGNRIAEVVPNIDVAVQQTHQRLNWSQRKLQNSWGVSQTLCFDNNFRNAECAKLLVTSNRWFIEQQDSGRGVPGCRPQHVRTTSVKNPRRQKQLRG